MKALADENFPRAAVLELRNRGWDVLIVQDWKAAAADVAVAAKARDDNRLLLTFDKDFGELWRRTRSSGYPGYRRSKPLTGSSVC